MNKVSIQVALSDGSSFCANRATEQDVICLHSVISDAGGLLEASAAVREQIEAMTNAGLVELVIVAFPKD